MLAEEQSHREGWRLGARRDPTTFCVEVPALCFSGPQLPFLCTFDVLCTHEARRPSAPRYPSWAASQFWARTGPAWVGVGRVTGRSKVTAAFPWGKGLALRGPL